jgi:hypothetical protein
MYWLIESEDDDFFTGELDYLSDYEPILNKEGEIIGYYIDTPMPEIDRIYRLSFKNEHNLNLNPVTYSYYFITLDSNGNVLGVIPLKYVSLIKKKEIH